jgi:hypothetical protein
VFICFPLENSAPFTGENIMFGSIWTILGGLNDHGFDMFYQMLLKRYPERMARAQDIHEDDIPPLYAVEILDVGEQRAYVIRLLHTFFPHHSVENIILLLRGAPKTIAHYQTEDQATFICNALCGLGATPNMHLEGENND